MARRKAAELAMPIRMVRLHVRLFFLFIPRLPVLLWRKLN